VFLFDRPRSFDDAERQTMAALASICSQAMGRARRYEFEHEVSITLQQGLLASPVPDVAGVRIATRYVPAFQRLEVGGDWHQVIPLPDGRVGLAVGDVVGKGAEAASTMAQLRSALAGAAISRPEPEDALGVLRRASGVIPGAEAATVAYAVLDPAARSLRYARAGHPYPLLARADGSVARLDGGGAPPLLAWDETEIAADEIRVRPGDRLLLYTDGLIERREVSIDAGLAGLEGLVAGAGDLDVESLCDAIVHGCLPGGRPRDDVALLCAEVSEPPG